MKLKTSCLVLACALLSFGAGPENSVLLQTKPGSVKGKVVDAAGAPIEKVALTLNIRERAKMNPNATGMQAGDTPGFKVVARAVTDKEGVFTFPNIKAGRYFVIGGNDDIGNILERVTVENGKEATLQITLTK